MIHTHVEAGLYWEHCVRLWLSEAWIHTVMPISGYYVNLWGGSIPKFYKCQCHPRAYTFQPHYNIQAHRHYRSWKPNCTLLPYILAQSKIWLKLIWQSNAFFPTLKLDSISCPNLAAIIATSTLVFWSWPRYKILTFTPWSRKIPCVFNANPSLVNTWNYLVLFSTNNVNHYRVQNIFYKLKMDFILDIKYEYKYKRG